MHPRVIASMTLAQKRAHVDGLRKKAAHIRSCGDRRSSEILREAADAFEEKYIRRNPNRYRRG